MDIRKIKKLIELVEESGIDELEITEGEESVRIARNRAPSAVSYSLPPAMAPMAAPIAAAPAPDVEASKGTAPAASEPSTQGFVQRSPMVGSFYRSPSPTSPRFVEVGATVQVGDVLCIIESMNLMNEITSDFDGTITEICVSNQQVVDYAHPLFRIRKETP